MNTYKIYPVDCFDHDGTMRVFIRISLAEHMFD